MWHEDVCDRNSTAEGVTYPPLSNKFHFEATIADEFSCKRSSEGYFIHRITIVGDYEECSATMLCAALHMNGYPLSYEASLICVIVIAKRFDLDKTSLEAASLLKVEVSLNEEAIDGCVAEEPRFHQALIRSIINALLQNHNFIRFRTATQDTGVVAKLSRNELKSKSSTDAVVYSFKGITSAGKGKVSISFEVDNFEMFDYGLEVNLVAKENIIGQPLILVADNAPVSILKLSTGFLTEVDKINVVRGYNTYLPATSAQSSMYWNLRTGCKEFGSSMANYEVKFTEENRSSFIAPSKVLARSIQERNARTRTSATKQAQDLLDFIAQLMCPSYFSSLGPSTPRNSFVLRDRFLRKKRHLAKLFDQEENG